MYRIIPLFIFLIFQQNLSTAQRMDHLRGDLIIQLQTAASAQRLAARYETKTSLAPVSQLVVSPNIWRFTYDANAIGERSILSLIGADKEVVQVQFNHFVKLRSTIPDDSLFDSQWQYINTGINGGLENADLDMDLAWDITTGGVTALGDTIVVCVIDGGFDLSHQDLIANRWFNHAEIPNNGVDDDGNGYVDDVRGWFSDANNDNVAGGSHGTSVAGIIGAKGNNNLGVSGISWDVKVMLVRSDSGLESDVIAAYNYPLVQRKRYNESNGTEGAFVVATNASWGIDGGMAADAPIWCAFYDTLGHYGILNCGATANADVNVETFGDLPTTCTSDYLISVTNLKRNDVKETQAGYGRVSIDLGAYGTGVFTTTDANSYGAFGGTSGATPHVTGSIGLMYAIPCMDIAELAKTNPAACALLMKEAILNSVVPNPSLEGITVTEGRLNTNNALNYLLDACDGCFLPTVLRADEVTDVQASLSWAYTNSVINADLRWRLAGTDEWTEVTEVTVPYLLTGLTACTEYEFQVKSNCADSTSIYSESAIFKTDGCCEAPSTASALNIDGSSAVISWPSVLAATSYLVNYRAAGTANWNNLLAFETSYTIDELAPCTEYEYQVETKCGVESGGFTPIQSFRTTECGACADATYCDPILQEVDTEWIEHFICGPIDNLSGNDEGYGNYTLDEGYVFEKGQIYSLSIEPKYDGFTQYSEDAHIWIDWNKNETFEEEEIIFAAPETFNSLLEGNITIPADILPGETRLRVGMMFMDVTGPCPPGFGGVFGEFEDYCITVQEAQSCVVVHEIDTTDLSLNSVVIHWNPITVANNYTVAYRKVGDTEFITSTTFLEEATLLGLEKCTDYEVKITTNCTSMGTVESELFQFFSACDIGFNEPEVIQKWNLYPNPFNDLVNMDIQSKRNEQNLLLSVYNQYGQKIREKSVELQEGENRLELVTTTWPAGVYFVALISADGRQQSVRKLVKLD